MCVYIAQVSLRKGRLSSLVLAVLRFEAVKEKIGLVVAFLGNVNESHLNTCKQSLHVFKSVFNLFLFIDFAVMDSL